MPLNLDFFSEFQHNKKFREKNVRKFSKVNTWNKSNFFLRNMGPLYSYVFPSIQLCQACDKLCLGQDKLQK